MAVRVHEVMNREIFSVSPTATVHEAAALFERHQISGAPVLDPYGVPLGMVALRELVGEGGELVQDRMTMPPMAVPGSASLEDAAMLLCELDLHRALVVNEAGALMGIVTSLDLLRGFLGLPTPHPHEHPPTDELTGLVWSDGLPLASSTLLQLPAQGGLLVLVHGGKGLPERIVWAEAASGIRARVQYLLQNPGEVPAHLRTALKAGELRVRFAASEDTARRMTALRAVLLDARNQQRKASSQTAVTRGFGPTSGNRER